MYLSLLELDESALQKVTESAQGPISSLTSAAEVLITPPRLNSSSSTSVFDESLVSNGTRKRKPSKVRIYSFSERLTLQYRRMSGLRRDRTDLKRC